MGCLCSKQKKVGNKHKKSIDTYVNKNNTKPDQTVNTYTNKDLILKVEENNNPKYENLQTETMELSPPEEQNQVKSTSFNKELCKSIANSLPERPQTTLQSLKDTMKSQTNNLSDFEKSYILFLWICDNIAYDTKSFFAGTDVDCSPEGVFQNGSSVCSGYSRLFNDIGSYIGLDIENVVCYAKGVGYEPGQIMNETNHEYNVVKINNKWYPIDSTWGAGHVDKQDFIKSYNEFYFMADPELLIKTHFPADDKWQLTKRKYTLEEFLRWPLIKHFFFKYGFTNFSPEEGLINLYNTNQQKFIIYGENMDQKAAMSSVYLLNGNTYCQKLNSSMENFYNDRFEVDCIFNQKGKYKVQIFANIDKGKKNHDMILEYMVNVQNNAIQQLAFPTTFKGHEEINIIEPLYDNLRQGQPVKFKIESKLDEIIIIDGEWHHLNKNQNGYFEFDTVIKTQRGNNVNIGKKNGMNGCDSLVSYKVI